MSDWWDDIWQGIVEIDPESVSATLVLTTMEEVPVTGFFHSGTYGLASEARYAREKSVHSAYFYMLRSVLDDMQFKNLTKGLIRIGEASYQIISVSGTGSGMLKLELKERA